MTQPNAKKIDKRVRPKGRRSKSRMPLPNGGRLSCAAVRWFSQMQFYYDGRRQPQPLVRLRTDIRRSDPALERN